MGVPVDYSSESCGLGIKVESRDVVENVDEGAANFDDFRLGQSSTPS